MPRNKPTKLPGLNLPRNLDPEQRAFFEGVKETLETMLAGSRGDAKDRVATIAELEKAGVIKANVKNNRAEVRGFDVDQVTKVVTRIVSGGGEGSAGGLPSHIHTIADVTDLQGTLDLKAPLVHAHEIDDVNGLQPALDAKSDVGHTHNGLAPAGGAAGEVLTKVDGTDFNYNWAPAAGGGGGEANVGSNVGTSGEGVYDGKSGVTLNFRTVVGGQNVSIVLDDTENTLTFNVASFPWADLSDVPATFPPASHEHAIADVTGLQAALDGKAAVGHNHDGVYSPVAHNHDGVYEPALGNPDNDGMVLSSSAAGVRAWTSLAVGGGGGYEMHFGDGVPDPNLGQARETYLDKLTGALYKRVLGADLTRLLLHMEDYSDSSLSPKLITQNGVTDYLAAPGARFGSLGLDLPDNVGAPPSNTNKSGTPRGVDPDESNLVFLLGAETIIAEDTADLPVSVFGNGGDDPVLSSTVAKFGTNSVKAVGAPSSRTRWLEVPASQDWVLDGDFTIEGWWYPTTITNFTSLIGTVATLGKPRFWITITGSVLYVSNYLTQGGGQALTYWGAPITINQWHHIVISRSGTTWKCWVNGVDRGAPVNGIGINTLNVEGHLHPLGIGYPDQNADNHDFNGYYEDIRIYKGLAKYGAASGDITVPTEPFPGKPSNPNFSSATLYLPFESDLNDHSNEGAAMTVTGNVTVQGGSPLIGSGSAKGNTNGGRYAHFLRSPTDATKYATGTGDFTIMMYYRMPTGALGNAIQLVAGSGGQYQNANYWGVRTRPSDGLPFVSVGAQERFLVGTGGLDVPVHVAIIRKDGDTQLYVDGVAVGAPFATSDTVSYGIDTGYVEVFQGNATHLDNGDFVGTVDEFVFVPGVALYDGPFTPPVAPFSQGDGGGSPSPEAMVLETELAGATDLAGHAVTNNGLVFTANPKFGDGSVTGPDFNTVSDVRGLTVAGSGNDFVLDGDFTIEGWVERRNGNPALVRSKFVSGAATGSDTARDWILSTASGIMKLLVATDAGGNQFVGSNGSATIGFGDGFHHFVAMRDNTAGKIYFGLDGVWSAFPTSYNPATSEFGDPLGASGQDLYVGRGAANSLNSGNADLQSMFRLDGVRIAKELTYDPTAPYTVPTEAFTYSGGGGGGEEPPAGDGSFVAPSGTVRLPSLMADERPVSGVEEAKQASTTTLVGEAALSEDQAKFYNKSINTGGSAAQAHRTNYCRVAPKNADDFNFPAGTAFTIEGWIRSRGETLSPYVYEGVFSDGMASIVNGSWTLQYKAAGLNFVTYSGGWNVSPAWPMTHNEWHHIAIVRTASNQMYCFIDGVSQSWGQTWAVQVGASNGDILIGGPTAATDNRDFEGFTQEFRVTKGVARYTSNFTPPSAPFPDSSSDPSWGSVKALVRPKQTKGLVMLIGAETNLKDDSGYGHDPVQSGSVSRVSSFGGQTPKFGTYFYHTQNGVFVPPDHYPKLSSPGFSYGVDDEFIFNDDFTWEGWYSFTSFANTQGLFGDSLSILHDALETERNFELRVTTGGLLKFRSHNGTSWTDHITSAALSLNTWYHIAVTRQGTVLRLFLDGALVGSADLGVVEQYGGLNRGMVVYGGSYGAFSEGSDPTYGPNAGFEEIRLYNGVCKYTAAFTPPTTVFPSPIGDTAGGGSGGSAPPAALSRGMQVSPTTALELSQEFTLDFWAKPAGTDPSAKTQLHAFGLSAAQATDGWFGAYLDNATGDFVFQWNEGASVQTLTIAAADLAVGAWNHIAVVRHRVADDDWRYYIYSGGVRRATVNRPSAYSLNPGGALALNVGMGATDAEVGGWYGALDEMRLVTEKALYTGSTLSVPVLAFATDEVSGSAWQQQVTLQLA